MAGKRSRCRVVIAGFSGAQISGSGSFNLRASSWNTPCRRATPADALRSRAHLTRRRPTHPGRSGDEHEHGYPDHGVGRARPGRVHRAMGHYFEKSGPGDMRKEAVGVMDYFGIDHTGVERCDIATGGNVRAEMWPDGRLDIGEKLFSNSFGMIAATLYHEVDVHWNLQLSKPDVVLGDTQAWIMREVQAYDLEIKNM